MNEQNKRKVNKVHKTDKKIRYIFCRSVRIEKKKEKGGENYLRKKERKKKERKKYLENKEESFYC